MMTVAAVLTVAVSLSLVGGALLLKQSAAQASFQWQQGTRRDGLDATHRLNGRDFYDQDPTRDHADREGLRLFHPGPGLPGSQETAAVARVVVLTVAEVPSSYQCIPTVPSDAFLVRSTLSNEPGVYEVTAPNKQIREMNKVIRVMQIIFLALAGVLFFSAMVLILNTIRMAIFSRRREVSVMKLVGATNWFIRIPYITEGFIQGLFGSIVAIGAVTALHTWYPLPTQFKLSVGDLVGSNAVVLIMGVGHWLGRFGDRHSPIPRRLVVRLAEVNRRGVDAVAQSRRRGSVIKDVAQVTTALCAENLGALHKKHAIGAFNDGARFAGVKARPSRAGIEFLTRGEEC
jgi:cell division transport system permease protein